MSAERAVKKLLTVIGGLVLWPVMAIGQVTEFDGLDGAGSARSSLRADDPYGRLPLSFEANQGQTDSRVKFLSRGSGYGLFLTPTEIVLSLSKSATPKTGKYALSDRQKKGGRRYRDAQVAVLRMKLKGANPSPKVVGLEELPGKSNYFIGNDPKRWRTNVPRYAKVKYKRMYPGIDLLLHGRGHELEYDLLVSPGADPSQIRLVFEGTERLTINAEGELVLHTPRGEIRQLKPVIYQELDGVRRDVPGRYVLEGKNQVSFRVASYDPSQALVVDPVLIYSSHLGGSSEEYGRSVVVDDDGDAYVVGQTRSTDFPTVSALQPANASPGREDAYVGKFNAEGVPIFMTYLGGSGNDGGYGVALDAQGNIFVSGRTDSADFPRVAAIQSTFGGFFDAFVTKLNPSGSAMLFSTYLGGDGGDRSTAMAVDSQGSAYVVGESWSGNFGTVPPRVPEKVNQDIGVAVLPDVFVAKLTPNGSNIEYLTYLNGESYESEPRVVVDGSRNAYITGSTFSSPPPDRTRNPFPASSGAFQGSHGGSLDAFVTKLDPSGLVVVYSTLLGGNAPDHGNGIALDPGCLANCNAYVTGLTWSTNFPTTPTALWPTFGGTTDAFVTKLSSLGSALIYSTYLGRSRQDFGWGIAIDRAGNAYVTGKSHSSSFPVDKCAVRLELGATIDDNDVFVAKLNAQGTTLHYCAFLGGSGGDRGYALALTEADEIWITGDANSGDFPITPNAFQRTYGGSEEAFIAKISDPGGGGARLQFSSPNYSVIEDRGAAVIIVTRRGGTDGTVTVDYNTSDGTATAPDDYAATSGALSFADRETAKAFTVPIVDDVLVEGDETVNLTLSNPTGGASLGFPSTAVLTIHDDDGLSRTFVVRDRVLPTGPNWTASEEISWLSLDAYSGTGPSTVTATADPMGLPVGTYTGTITVTGDTGDSPQVVQVTLRVTP